MSLNSALQSPNLGLESPLGYFITFSTYASHLHGDERLSVTRARNQVGSERLAPDPEQVQAARRSLRAPPVLMLTPEERALCTASMVDSCRRRSWPLWALNVRTNHVHVVVSAKERPEKVMGVLKCFSTHALRKANRFRDDQPVWTRHGSTIWLNSVEALERACRYVVEGQGGRQGVVGAAFSGDEETEA